MGLGIYETFRKLSLLLLLLTFVAAPLNSRPSGQLLNLTQQEEEHKEEGTSEVYKALEIRRTSQIHEIHVECIHIHKGKVCVDYIYTTVPLHKNPATYNLTLRAPPTHS